MEFTRSLVWIVTISLPMVVRAQELQPSEICERLLAAYQTSDFSRVSPYVHSRTLKEFRVASSAIVSHATEKYGEPALVEFFQGANLRDLDSLSDEGYWATVMACTFRSARENPTNIAQPVAQFADNNGLVLVYAGKAGLKTAPEAGSFVWHRAYSFQRENGIWKLSSLIVDTFEASLCAFLQNRSALSHP
jgi:hypothetical protein